MKPLHWYAGTMLIGAGDAIGAVGEAVVELGWLVRQGGALMAAVPPSMRRRASPPVAARMEHHRT